MMRKLSKTSEIVKLSTKDIRIIKELNKDSRQSFSKIGKKVGLPKNVVNYRINKLIDNRVITLFCTTINRGKLAYMYWRLFLKFQYFSEHIENELILHISKLHNIHWVASLDGSFDFCIIFLAKTIGQVDKLYDSLICPFDKYIVDRELSLATTVRYLPYNYLYETVAYGVEEIKPEDEPEKLDNKDYQLLNLIKENSRIPMIELVAEMKLSPQMIRSRMKTLMKKKIIIGYNIRVDHTKFHLNHFHTCLRLTNMTKERRKDIIALLCSKKSTTQIIKGFGRWDLEFESVFPSHFELHDLFRELKNKFSDNITLYDSVLIYKVYPINTVTYE